MAEILARSPTNPEFPRVIETMRLRGASEVPFDLTASAEECVALARLLGAQAVRKLRFRGRLAPAPDAAWRLTGELGATVVQTCVVTLEPVTTRVDAPVRRLFAPHATASLDIDLDAEDDDEAEPLGDAIDLGLVAIEALALALPAYPRAEGAELGELARSAPPGVAPIAEGDLRPFAALAALRDRKPDGS
jgi:uncharacterized metal-binding protein YceD (DUF177 family)